MRDKRQQNLAYNINCKSGSELWKDSETELRAYASGTALSSCEDDSQFSCGTLSNSIECVDMRKRCNGIQDCTNGRDEEKCGTCIGETFHCGNMQCIQMNQVCNGNKDCKNGRDEENCAENGNTTEITKFKCRSNKLSIDVKYRCTGIISGETCSDGSHNVRCETCKNNSISCGDGQCILSEHICDGDVNCFNGFDEYNCTLCREIQKYGVYFDLILLFYF